MTKTSTNQTRRQAAQPATIDSGEKLSVRASAFIRELVDSARSKEILRAQSAFEALAERASLAEVLALRLRLENSADLSTFL